MRSKFGWKRPPVTASIWLSTYSRSRKAKNTGGDGAELDAEVAEEQRRCWRCGDSSNRIVRMHWARGGASMLHQLLGGEDERHLVGEAAEPVDAVDQRGDLRVGADLGELLVAAVHVAARRLGPTRPARRRGGTTMRSVPWVAGCCGPMLRVMPSVSSSTLTRASAAWRGDVGELLAIGDGRSCRSPPRRRRLVVGSSSSSPGIGSTSTMPGHGFTMRASSGKSLRSG